MICGRQGLRKYKDKDKHKEKYKEKYKNNRHAYDIVSFCKGDDNRSLIMKNVQNMQNNQSMQNLQNLQNMQNMQNMQNTKTVRIQHITSHHFLYSEFHEENLNHQETNGE